jgi:hypothetical protein
MGLNLAKGARERASDMRAALVGMRASPDDELVGSPGGPRSEAGRCGVSQRCSRTYFFMGHAQRGERPCLPAKRSVSHVVLSPVIRLGTRRSVRAAACGPRLPIGVARLNELSSWGAGRVWDPGWHVSRAGTGQGWVGSPRDAPPPPPPPLPLSQRFILTARERPHLACCFAF